MQEHRLALAQPLDRHLDHVASAHETRLGVAYRSAALEAALSEPIAHEVEPLAAVVDLFVFESPLLPVDPHLHVLGQAVAHSRQVLGEVDRRVRVVADAEQEHLRVELEGAADRTVEAVRRIDGVRPGDRACRGSARRERMGLSLRSTPGSRQKVSATIPMPAHGVARGSKT